MSRLTLFGKNSPYTSPFNDTVKGNTLSTNELDDNLIYLKGLSPKELSFDGTNLLLYKINGDNLSINLNDIIQNAVSGNTNGISITGGTFNDLNGELSLVNNTGGTINISGFFTADDDTLITGLTFNQSTYQLSLNDNKGASFSSDLSILSSDLNITGGTYDSNTGIATFTNNSGGTFDVSGFIVGLTDVFITGGSYNQITGNVTLINTTGGTFSLTGFNTTQYTNYIIPSGDTIIIPTNEQYLIYGDLLLEGQLDNFGQVVIIDGLLVNSGGTFNNYGELILVDTNVQFSGNTSGTCINELFVNKIQSCSDSTNLEFGLGTNFFGSFTGGTWSYSGGNESAAFFLGDTNAFGKIIAWTYFDGTIINSISSNNDSSRFYYNEIGTDEEIELKLTASGVTVDLEGSQQKSFKVEDSASGSTFFDVNNSGHITCPSTTGTFTPPKLNAAQISAITPIAGMLIYNTDTNKHQGYDGTIWNNLY